MSSLPPSAPDTATSSPAPLGSDIPPWPLWTLPAVLLLGLGLWAILSVLVEIVAAAAGASISHPPPAVSLALDLIFDVSFVAATLYFTVHKGEAQPADFGYRRVGFSLAVGAFLTAGIGYYVLTFLYAAVFSLHGQDKLPNELGVTHSTAALIGAAVFVCVVAPVAEELFFRGFIFGGLRRLRITIAGRDVGTWVAAMLTGVLFGLAHGGSASPQYLVPLGLLGFILCLLRWRTGSLYPCMALHSVNNSLALGIDQLHWSALGILGLMVAAGAVIAACTGPLAGPELPASRNHVLPDKPPEEPPDQ